MANKNYSQPTAIIMATVPTGAQVRGNRLHVQLGTGKYAAGYIRIPGDKTERDTLFAALAKLPVEATFSGSGRKYFTLTIGAAIRSKGLDMAVVPLTAGEDGPVAAYVLVDPSLVESEESAEATDAAQAPVPEATPAPPVAPVPDEEEDEEEEEEEEEEVS